jgi:hypothetical protein
MSIGGSAPGENEVPGSRTDQCTIRSLIRINDATYSTSLTYRDKPEQELE